MFLVVIFHGRIIEGRHDKLVVFIATDKILKFTCAILYICHTSIPTLCRVIFHYNSCGLQEFQNWVSIIYTNEYLCLCSVGIFTRVFHIYLYSIYYYLFEILAIILKFKLYTCLLSNSILNISRLFARLFAMDKLPIIENISIFSLKCWIHCICYSAGIYVYHTCMSSKIFSQTSFEQFVTSRTFVWVPSCISSMQVYY